MSLTLFDSQNKVNGPGFFPGPFPFTYFVLVITVLLICNIREVKSYGCSNELVDSPLLEPAPGGMTTEMTAEGEPSVLLSADADRWLSLRITHYSDPIDSHPSRWIKWDGGSGVTLQDCVWWATELHLDGICAVGRETPWYKQHRETPPPILEVEDHGTFLVVDRIGHGSDVDIYIWPPPPHDLFAHYKMVREVVLDKKIICDRTHNLHLDVIRFLSYI